VDAEVCFGVAADVGFGAYDHPRVVLQRFS
jgi:hypothetical protein